MKASSLGVELALTFVGTCSVADFVSGLVTTNVPFCCVARRPSSLQSCIKLGDAQRRRHQPKDNTFHLRSSPVQAALQVCRCDGGELEVSAAGRWGLLSLLHPHQAAAAERH